MKPMKNTVKILFVCHGNICRSPMAEFVMKDLVRQKGLADVYEIASAATSREEIGNPVYPPARRKLAEHGISCAGHAARQRPRLWTALDRIIVYHKVRAPATSERQRPFSLSVVRLPRRSGTGGSIRENNVWQKRCS